MSYIKRVTAKLGIMGELLKFFWERKLWWLRSRGWGPFDTARRVGPTQDKLGVRG